MGLSSEANYYKNNFNVNLNPPFKFKSNQPILSLNLQVTVGRVAKLPGGEVLGKWRVMWGLEVGVPGREAVGEH